MIFHQINQLASTTRSNQHYQQPTCTNLRFWDKDWIQEMNQGLRGDGAGEDVDGDFPLPMRGALVMTMAMISPSRREVSPVEQLCRSPRLVPPRFRLVAAESRPKRLLMIFLRTKDFIQQKMATGGPTGGPRGRGRPGGQGALPPSWTGEPPLTWILLPVFFIISKNNFRGVSGLLELCRIGL